MENSKSGAGLSRPAKPLSHKLLESLRPETAPYRVPDSRTRGLAVRVATDGGISWDCSFRISGTGKGRRASLGRWPADMSIEQARDRANELTRAARAGRDLLAEEEASRRVHSERTTVGAMIDEYVKRRVAGRLRTAQEIERRLKRALAALLDRPAADVRRRDLRVELDAVADAGTAREAEKRRQCIGSMWKWAVAADIVENNATSGLPRYDGGTPRKRVLAPEEIAALWRWLPDSGLPAAHADVLRLCLLLGARCGEVAGMWPSEVDAAQRTWTLPASRSKNGQPRVTPLVGIAWDVLSKRLETATKGPLFPTETEKPLTAAHVGHILLSRTLPIAKFVTHDLRRTLATGMDEMGISRETIAAVLGHAAGGTELVAAVSGHAVDSDRLATLRRHYIHSENLDPKRRALEAWSRRVAALIDGETATSTVVPFAPVSSDVQMRATG
jgi:integrase